MIAREGIIDKWRAVVDNGKEQVTPGPALSSSAQADKIAKQSPQTLLSPVQEHHIDFILEEEFACNPAFLVWFLEAVKWHSERTDIDASNVTAHNQWDCMAVRSVTTEAGETDVLVIYRSAGESERTAILVEDKIRAGFQPAQPERYQSRGLEGKINGAWDQFWTCLVSPQKYGPGAKGFDASLSLETLRTFFSGNDQRSRFKAAVIERAIHHFQETGLQIKDEKMTRFRALYSQKAEAAFIESGVKWPVARDAWWDDQWFRFTGGGIPQGAEIVHKSRAGFIDLGFPKTDVSYLQHALLRSKSTDPGFQVTAVQTGKSASLRVRVAPVADFADLSAAEQIIDISLLRIRDLITFYKNNELNFRAIS